MTSEEHKAWIGLGISQYYLGLVQRLPEVVIGRGYRDLTIMVADGLDRQFNAQNRSDLASEIYRQSQAIRLEGTRVRTIRSDELQGSERLAEIRAGLWRWFRAEDDFKMDVVALVRKNRQGIKDELVERAAGYVIEELALIREFSEKGYVKLGPIEKEKPFDALAMKYLGLRRWQFDWFH